MPLKLQGIFSFSYEFFILQWRTKINWATTYTVSAAPKRRTFEMFSVISTVSCAEVPSIVEFLRNLYSVLAEFKLATYNSQITTQNLDPQNFTLAFLASEAGCIEVG
jgi:hypothetical protein